MKNTADLGEFELIATDESFEQPELFPDLLYYPWEHCGLSLKRSTDLAEECVDNTKAYKCKIEHG